MWLRKATGIYIVYLICSKEAMFMRYIPQYYNLFDDVFDAFDSNFNSSKSLMRTDISEKDGNYLLEIELPGYQKEDVKVELKNGYLSIDAKRNSSNDEKDDKGRIIRQERYAGSIHRSFYVGDDIRVEDVKAKFDNGILQLTVPSERPKEIENSHHVAIE